MRCLPRPLTLSGGPAESMYVVARPVPIPGTTCKRDEMIDKCYNRRASVQLSDSIVSQLEPNLTKYIVFGTIYEQN